MIINLIINFQVEKEQKYHLKKSDEDNSLIVDNSRRLCPDLSILPNDAQRASLTFLDDQLTNRIKNKKN